MLPMRMRSAPAAILVLLLTAVPAVAGPGNGGEEGHWIQALEAGPRGDATPAASRRAGRQAADEPTEGDARADSSRHPNDVPYRTDRSLAYHVLAFPSYVIDAVTYPLGVTVRYLETNFPSLFRPKPVVRGVRPLIELGGPNGVQGGLALFHHDLWGAGHDVRASGEVAARESWEVEMQYAVPSPLGWATTLQFFGEYAVNDERRFFVGGNNADEDADEAQFYGRRLDVRTLLAYDLGERWGGETQVRYQHVRTRPSEEDPERGERIVGQPGLGVTDFVSVSTEAIWDGTRTYQRRQTHRRVGGTVLLGRLGYTHDLASDRFRYATVVGEVQQYVPLPFLPPGRRLALRARIEKNEPLLGGEAVPFYDLRGLGGQESLRGFRFDRFVDDGLLLLNAEYRYPIWDSFDAVLFVDSGQAFTRVGDIAADRFRWSYGGGVHLLSGRKLGARFEVARSVDGVRVLLTVTPTFGSRPVGD